VQSGIALVMCDLLETMYAYCKGSPSTPQLTELGRQLIEAVAYCISWMAAHFASGAVGNVRSQG
jgi:hypothetical protein